MRLALALAERALGMVAPNPAVGCVLVAQSGQIIGRGATRAGGRPHAETEALDQCRAIFGSEAAALLNGATAYVTLEPCSHHGVTGPCAEALVAAKVGHVVVALQDPDPRVAGRGLALLDQAGIDVSLGEGAKEAESLTEGFLLNRLQGRPLVTLKAAATLDGRIAAASGHSQWITGPAARSKGHLMRANHDAILIGSGTAMADNPRLTCRVPGLETRSPHRVLLDGRLRLTPDAALFADINAVPLTIFCREGADPKRIAALKSAGARVIPVPPAGDSMAPSAVLKALAEAGITRVLLEGGGQVAAAFLKDDLVDRIAWFHGPKVIGGDGLPAIGPFGVDRADETPLFTVQGREVLGEDILTMAYRVRA